MKRVLVICDQHGVSEFYRTLTPYRLLAAAGHIDLVTDDGQNPAIINSLDQFDAVVFSRSDSPEHSLILLHARQRGVKVVFDIDDNLFIVPPSIPAYDAWHVRGHGAATARLWYLKQNIKLADVLTVSTQALGRQLCDGDPLRLRPEGDYLVLPNMILASDWAEGGEAAELQKAPGEVHVGWWGIYNHWDDWRDIAPYIEPVIAGRPWVKLIVLGMPEVAYLFPRLRANNQLVVGPFVAPEKLNQYRALVKQFDIALAPTAQSAFNESKSDLKALQYGAAGVPVIASAVTYRDWGNLAIVLDSPRLWGKALEIMLDNPDLAHQAGQALQQHVLEQRTYEGNYERWLEALG